MKYLRQYEELKFKNPFKKNKKEVVDQSISKEEISKLKHTNIESIDVSDVRFRNVISWECKITLKKSLIDSIIKLDNRISGVHAIIYPNQESDSPVGISICFIFSLVGDDYSYLKLGRDIRQGIMVTHMTMNPDVWLVKKYVYLPYINNRTDEVVNLDKISSFFGDILQISRTWALTSALDESTKRYNRNIKTELIQSHISEIEDYFVDLIDLSYSHHIMKNQAGGITSIFDIEKVYVDNLGDRTFRLDGVMSKVMDSLLEVEGRVSELIPGAEFLVDISHNKVSIYIK